MTARVIALPWVRRGDYEEVRRIMEDGAAWHDQYDEWLAEAEEQAKLAEAQDVRVVRVMIEPYEFDVWCAANDMRKDAAGRNAFALENAATVE